MKFALIVLLNGLALGTGMGGCSGDGTSNGTPFRQPIQAASLNALRVHLANEPMTLDPGMAEDGVSLQVLNNVWDGLVGYDGEGRLENRIAESYSISKDGKKYEFTLRKNALWSDGQTVTTQNFISAFRRMLSPKTVCKLAPLFLSIRGAQAYHESKAGWERVGMKEHQGKLVFELEHPASYFIHTLTLPPAFPLRQEFLNQTGGAWMESGPTTGPYTIDTHQVDQRIVLKANPYYWDRADRVKKGKPPIPAVEFIVVADESTATHLFENGTIDLLTRVPSLDLSRLKKMKNIHTDLFLATYYISFNCRKPPFSDPRWRRAVAGAIRRDEISEITGGGEMPARSWIPKGLEGYLPYEDPRPLFLDSMEWFKNHVKKPELISAGFDTGARNSRIMEKILQDLKQTLGLNLTLMNLDWRTYGKVLQSDPPSIFRYGWLSPIMDPISHLRAFQTGDPNNYSGWSNSRYDFLVKEIEETAPGSVRNQKIMTAQKILVEEEVAVIPIYHYVQNTGVSSRVHGFKVNPFGVIRIWDLSLDPESNR